MRASILSALAWLLAAFPLAAAEETPLANPAQEAAAQALFKDIRCQVCQGQSIADSNAELARSMRMVIRDEVRSGQPQQAILDKMVREYGDSILMIPPVNAMTFGLWKGPFFIFLAILAGMVWLFRKSRRAAS